MQGSGITCIFSEKLFGLLAAIALAWLQQDLAITVGLVLLYRASVDVLEAWRETLPQDWQERLTMWPHPNKCKEIPSTKSSSSACNDDGHMRANLKATLSMRGEDWLGLQLTVPAISWTRDLLAAAAAMATDLEQHAVATAATRGHHANQLTNQLMDFVCRQTAAACGATHEIRHHKLKHEEVGGAEYYTQSCNSLRAAHLLLSANDTTLLKVYHGCGTELQRGDVSSVVVTTRDVGTLAVFLRILIRNYCPNQAH
eukprot:s1796_g15.t1